MSVTHGFRETTDERDQEIIARRASLLVDNRTPQVGDWVTFADGVERRISHIWRDYDDPDPQYSFPACAQTSKGGSFYMGEGYTSFSGSLFTSVPLSTFSATDEVRDGWVWIFHHDHHTAHNGVDVQVPFRVWRCSKDAPKF